MNKKLDSEWKAYAVNVYLTLLAIVCAIISVMFAWYYEIDDDTFFIYITIITSLLLGLYYGASALMRIYIQKKASKSIDANDSDDHESK